MVNRLKLTVGLIAALGVSGCSMDFVPVHSSRVNSAKYAEQPLLRGPNAPGAFKFAWTFDRPQGYLFDPSELEISGGVLKLKAQPQASGRQEAMLVAHGGPSYVALDSFSVVPAEGNQGELRFQISANDSAWYFFKDGKWVLSGPNPNQANTAEELSAHIGQFHSEVAAGQLSLRVFLIAPTGKENVALKSINVQGIAPRVDGWN